MSYTDNLLKLELNQNKAYLDAKVIDLTSYDNPYDPGVKVREAVRGFNTTQLCKKPDATLKDLKKKLASLHQVNENQVVLTNGLAEALALVSKTCFNSDQAVMLPSLTCGAHVNACLYNNVKTTAINLNDDLTINVEALKDNGGVMLKNPNVPTGLALSKAQVETVLKNNPDVVVVVDEMYVGFGCESVDTLLATYPNLVIVRSFNAYRGLSGINLAYVLGSKEVMNALTNVKVAFNNTSVSTISALIATASLDDEEYVLKNSRMVVKTKDYLKVELEKMGFTVVESTGNYLLAKHKKTPASRIHDKLVKRNFHVATYDGVLENYIGFVVPTQDIANAFLKELKHAA